MITCINGYDDGVQYDFKVVLLNFILYDWNLSGLWLDQCYRESVRCGPISGELSAKMDTISDRTITWK